MYADFDPFRYKYIYVHMYMCVCISRSGVARLQCSLYSICFCLYDDSHSHWGELESQHSCDFHFPDG
jgi:hypothetical protein